MQQHIIMFKEPWLQNASVERCKKCTQSKDTSGQKEISGWQTRATHSTSLDKTKEDKSQESPNSAWSLWASVLSTLDNTHLNQVASSYQKKRRTKIWWRHNLKHYKSFQRWQKQLTVYINNHNYQLCVGKIQIFQDRTDIE